MEISITIPVQHYLKKYLAKTLEVSPLQMHNRCHITALLLEPLKKGFIPSREELSVKFNDYLTCVMNTSILRENRFHIDKDVVLRIDTLLTDKFNEDCFRFIDQQRSKDPNWHDQKSILEFMQYYDLQEEDIQFDTIIKRYYRHRKKLMDLPKPKAKPSKDELSSQLTFRFPDKGISPTGSESIQDLIQKRTKLIDSGRADYPEMSESVRKMGEFVRKFDR